MNDPIVFCSHLYFLIYQRVTRFLCQPDYFIPFQHCIFLMMLQIIYLLSLLFISISSFDVRATNLLMKVPPNTRQSL